MSQKILYVKGFPQSGEVLIARISQVRTAARILFRGLIACSLALVMLLLTPFLLMELEYRWQKAETASEKESKFAQIIQISDFQILNPVDPQFSLIIPKINLNSRVIAEVPVDKKENYQEALKKGVAHAQGSYFPGENGTIYLFGHSSDYFWNLFDNETVFYLLKELEEGDQINLFYQDQRYVYQVSDKKIMAADNLSVLKPRIGEEKLVLQTCWPLGTNWKRLIIVADKI